MIYQLEKNIADTLKEFFNQFDFIDKVVVFGSRARHDCTPKSDIDLCIYSLEMTDIQFSKLKFEIDELPILYKIDVVHFEKVNKELQDNVKRDGKLLFVKEVILNEIVDIKTGKYDANHEDKNGEYDFFTCAMLPSKANTFSFDDEVLILPGNGANVGRVFYYKGKLEAYQRTYILFNVKCHVKFLFYIMKNRWLLYTKRIEVGSATNYIKLPNIQNFKTPLPTLTKQKKIANALDKASELITLRKESIKKLDELSKSIFIDMFGDPISNPKKFLQKKLLNIIKLQRGFDLPKNERDLCGKFELYTANGLTSKHNKAKVFGGGVITGRSGTIGKVFYTKNDFWPLNTTLFSVETYGNNIIFLCYLLRFIKLDNYSESSSVPTLNRNIIHELNIIDVPKDLQTKFATIIEKIEEQKALYEKELKLLENNFDSLLDESFN